MSDVYVEPKPSKFPEGMLGLAQAVAAVNGDDSGLPDLAESSSDEEDLRAACDDDSESVRPEGGFQVATAEHDFPEGRRRGYPPLPSRTHGSVEEWAMVDQGL